MAGPPWRTDPHAVRALAVDRAVRHLLLVLRSARRDGGRRVQQRTARSRRPGGIGDRLPRHVSILVRVAPELAERVPGRRRAYHPVDLPATARVAGVEAGCRQPFGDRRIARTQWVTPRVADAHSTAIWPAAVAQPAAAVLSLPLKNQGSVFPVSVGWNSFMHTRPSSFLSD